MPSYYQTTWFFQGEQTAFLGPSPNYGWVESWYQQATSIEDALRFACDATNYINPRIGILSSVYRMYAARVTDVLNPRLVKSAVLPYAGLITTPAAQVQCAVLSDCVRLPTGTPGDTTHHRRFLVRGLPNAIITGNILNIVSVPYPALINFLNYLAVGPAPTPVGGVPKTPVWLLRYQDPAVLSAQVTALALNVDPVTNVALTMTLTAALGPMVRGDRILLKGVTNDPRFNRLWRVLQNAAGPPYQIGTAAKPILNAPAINPGTTARKSVKLYGPCQQYVLGGLRNKKTGRPPRLTRGRRAVLGQI